MNGFAAALRRFREAAGLSQRGLARRSGLTPAYVSLLEAGRRTPERPAVERLAGALALDEDDRGSLILAAGYAAPGSSALPKPGLLTGAEALIEALAATATERTTLVTLVEEYTRGLIARMQAGKPLVVDPAGPWQSRILAVLEEDIGERLAHSSNRRGAPPD